MSAPSPILKNFTCNFNIEDTDFCGTLSYDGDRDLTVTISEPSFLTGGKLICSEDGVSLEFSDFYRKFPPGNLPEISTVQYLYLAIPDAEERQVMSDRSGYYIDGTCKCGDYRLYINETGFVTKAEFFSTDKTVHFDGHTKT